MKLKNEPNSLESNTIDMIYDTLANNTEYPQVKEGNIEDSHVDGVNGEIEIYYWLDEIFTENGIEMLPEKKLMRVTMAITVEQIEGE